MCDKTIWFRGMCSGGRCTECPYDCGYSYCAYHLPPVNNVLVPKGGHVCSQYTAGTGIVGDNVFDMAANCVMLATSGPAGYASAKASALVLDATLEELIRNTPGGPQLNKLNNLRKKLKNAINGSPVAIIGVMKEISDAM